MNDVEGPSDAQVVARVLDGEIDAFGILVRRHTPALARYAVRLLGSPDAADDVLSESFARAYRHLASCRDPARFRTWVFRIVTNRCKSYLGRRRPDTVSLDDAPPPVARSNPGLDLDRREAMAAVESALAELSAQRREAFVMKYVEGLSYEEMAEITGQRIPTLKMRVHRAREALVRLLRERGL